MGLSDYYIQDNSDLENKKFEAAKEHYINGRYNDALGLYMSMLNMNTSHKLYYEIGRCYYKLNEPALAEEYFKKSTVMESLKNPSYTYLGNLYYKRNNLSLAIENWINAYAYKPDDEGVCLNLATSYFSKGMKFQSVSYYEKYLKYAVNKGVSYTTIKDSISKCTNLANDFYRKALKEIRQNRLNMALDFLNYAIQNLPTSFDINYLLGKTNFDCNDYVSSANYFKQAYFIDSRSMDVLKNLASVYINLGDYSQAYCTLRRLLPLVINNQAEYLRIMKIIKELSFNEQEYSRHRELAERYYSDNNYHQALLEYENSILLNDKMQDDLADKIEKIKLFINPERRIIKSCMEKGGALYTKGDYKTSNKYFSKIMRLSDEASSEYRYAKSRVVNV